MKSLIFDIDGTLWDIRSLCAAGYNRALKKHGLEHLSLNPQSLRSLFGKNIQVIADEIFDSIPAPERYRLIEECDREFQTDLQSATAENGFPGIREVLEDLARRHKLYIVSNCCKGYAELAMEKLGITHLISGHLCFGDTGLSKGQTILKLMQMYHIEDCVYIGDTQGDYEATLEAEIPFVWCAYGFGRPEHCTYKAESPKALKNLFD